jgi:Tol biopolymer transport system component
MHQADELEPTLGRCRRARASRPHPPGTARARLTHDVPGMLSAAWSPDGEYIAFGREGDDGGNPDIWIMKADGTSPARLTNAPEWDSLPTWGA